MASTPSVIYVGSQAEAHLTPPAAERAYQPSASRRTGTRETDPRGSNVVALRPAPKMRFIKSNLFDFAAQKFNDSAIGKASNGFLKHHFVSSATAFATSAGINMAVREGLQFAGLGVASGAAITGITIWKDYRKALKDHDGDERQALQQIQKNWKKYGMRLAFTAAAGSAGAYLADNPELVEKFTEQVGNTLSELRGAFIPYFSTENIEARRAAKLLSQQIEANAALVHTEIERMRVDTGGLVEKIDGNQLRDIIPELEPEPEAIAVAEIAPEKTGWREALSVKVAGAQEWMQGGIDQAEETIQNAARDAGNGFQQFVDNTGEKISDAYQGAADWLSQSIDMPEIKAPEGLWDNITARFESFFEGIRQFFNFGSVAELEQPQAPDMPLQPEPQFAMDETTAPTLDSAETLPPVAEPQALAEADIPEAGAPETPDILPYSDFVFDPSASITEQLLALAQNDQLGAQARESLKFALLGKEWALNEVADGMINGRFGFENVSSEQTQLFAAKIFEDLSAQGDAQAMRNFAYLQESGLYGVAKDHVAAMDKVAEAGMWYDPDAVPEQNIDPAPPRVVAECSVKESGINPETGAAYTKYSCGDLPDDVAAGDRVHVSSANGETTKISLGEKLAASMNINPGSTLADIFEGITTPRPDVMSAGLHAAPGLSGP